MTVRPLTTLAALDAHHTPEGLLRDENRRARGPTWLLSAHDARKGALSTQNGWGGTDRGF